MTTSAQIKRFFGLRHVVTKLKSGPCLWHVSLARDAWMLAERAHSAAHLVVPRLHG